MTELLHDGHTITSVAVGDGFKMAHAEQEVVSSVKFATELR